MKTPLETMEWMCGFHIGEDTGTPVSKDYQVPFRFSGTLESVTISLSDVPLTEEQLQQYREGRLKAAMSQ